MVVSLAKVVQVELCVAFWLSFILFQDCRALANNSKCQNSMSLHAQKWSDISGFSQTFHRGFFLNMVVSDSSIVQV